VHALRQLGYIEGQNLILERRSAEGRYERFGEIAAELVRQGIDVIVTSGNDMARETARVAAGIPIVMGLSSDPVEAGLVASLARPGGYITGFTVNTGPEIETKRLEMLKEAVPKASRVAFVGDKNDWEEPRGLSVRAAALSMGITLIHAEHTGTEHAGAFALIARDKPDALYVARNGRWYPDPRLIADFALAHRLPGTYPFRENVEAGGMMSYGADLAHQYRRAADYVDRILRGAAPGDLPIQQPTKFELVINLKTARALELTIPPALLVRADQLIE
jgi:putative ABC transport system substrate-binding protein